MNVLILFDGSKAGAVLAAVLLGQQYDGATYYNTNGVSSADITTYVGTLTNDAYDHIFTAVDLGSGSGELALAANATLWDKADQTIARADTAQAGGASTITLDSGASATDDEYNGYAVMIVGGTGAGQLRTISDYVGSTKVATVSVAWDTQPDATSEFEIVDVTDATVVKAFNELGTANTASQDANAIVNLALGTSYPEPYISVCLNGGRLQKSATATGIAAGTITDTGEFAGEDWSGAFAGIVSATTGANQIRPITSNTDNALTLGYNLAPTPTGTVVYSIAKDEKTALNSIKASAALIAYFQQPDSVYAVQSVQKMIDYAGGEQDVNWIQNWLDTRGQYINDSSIGFDYVNPQS